MQVLLIKTILPTILPTNTSLHKHVWSTLFLFVWWHQSYSQAQIPTGVTATGYDSHIELRWNQNTEPGLNGYKVYVAPAGGDEYTFLKYVDAPQTYYIDFVGGHDLTRNYKITSIQTNGQESDMSVAAIATTFEMTDDELLTMVQQYTFRYFWDFAHPASGMARERNTTSIVTTGGSGFGVMAILVGIERGFITRAQGLERLLKIVNFLESADRFKGAFPHWMNGVTGDVVPFSALDDGGDLVETAFMIQGLLTVRQYFNGNDPQESLLRDKITQIWETVDWNWYRKLVENKLYWHWSPNHGFAINLALRGFNETHIVYILAIASPVEALNIPASLYQTGWAGSNYTNGASYYGYPLAVGGYKGGPLFFSHYSYLGFDPRGKRDAYTNYFHRNTYHTLINRAHCIANPFNRVGYSEECWGLTASDDPFVGYLAHEPANSNQDNGTIAPTAAISSIPYTPQQSIQALKYFYRVLGAKTWGYYGFYDAFHLGNNWVSNTYLAIDQGPIICMIENYRTQLLWNNFMANPEIQPALDAIGFVPDSTVINQTKEASDLFVSGSVYPNPATRAGTITWTTSETANTSLLLYDLNGLMIRELMPQTLLGAGLHHRTFDVTDCNPGVYWVRICTDRQMIAKPLIIIK